MLSCGSTGGMGFGFGGGIGEGGKGLGVGGESEKAVAAREMVAVLAVAATDLREAKL